MLTYRFFKIWVNFILYPNCPFCWLKHPQSFFLIIPDPCSWPLRLLRVSFPSSDAFSHIPFLFCFHLYQHYSLHYCRFLSANLGPALYLSAKYYGRLNLFAWQVLAQRLPSLSTECHPILRFYPVDDSICAHWSCHMHLLTNSWICYYFFCCCLELFETWVMEFYSDLFLAHSWGWSQV